jgi:hypothetical protein
MEKIKVLWLIIMLIPIILASYFYYKNRNFKVVVMTFVVAIAFPVVPVIFYCNESRTSETCVWGQSLLPLYEVFFVFVVFPMIYLLVSFIMYAVKKY